MKKSEYLKSFEYTPGDRISDDVLANLVTWEGDGIELVYMFNDKPMFLAIVTNRDTGDSNPMYYTYDGRACDDKGERICEDGSLDIFVDTSVRKWVNIRIVDDNVITSQPYDTYDEAIESRSDLMDTVMVRSIPRDE